MAIGVYYHPQSMTAAQYDELMQRLDAAGAGRPDGRVHHCCLGTDDALMVFEIWDSPAALEAFAPAAMPILQELGLADAPPPVVVAIHNLVD